MDDIRLQAEILKAEIENRVDSINVIVDQFKNKYKVEIELEPKMVAIWMDSIEGKTIERFLKIDVKIMI